MNKRRLYISVTFVTITIASLCFTSCNHSFYSAKTGNTLDLNEKGDVQFEYTGWTDYISKGNIVKAGYSPLKHWGIQASYSNLKYANNKKEYVFSAATGYYIFRELGIQPDTSKWIIKKGRRIWMVKHGHKTGVLFDAYAGYGFGETYNRYYYLNNIQSTIRQYHIQEGVHFYFKRVLKFSIMHRLSLLHFKKAIVLGLIDNNGFRDLNIIKENNPFMINELSFKLSAGLPKVNTFLMVTTGTANKQFLYNNGSAQVGLAFDINDLFKK